MDTAKHTPGPWRDRDESGDYFCERSEWSAEFDGCPMGGTTTWLPILAGDKTVALTVSEGWDDSAMEANARLIAAAPDLLAALKAICSEFAQQHPLIVDGLAAIAKAEGE